MTTRRTISAFAVAALFSVSAFCYPPDHGPFEEGEAPPSVPLTECSIVRSECNIDEQPDVPSVLYFRAPDDVEGTTVKLERNIETDDWSIVVCDDKGRSLSGPAPARNDMPSYLYCVQSADLNQDGRPDFLVNIWSGGCGLAGAGSTTTFLLSSTERYEAANWHSYCFGPEDIVRFKEDGPCYFVHNELIGNGDEQTRDGRPHNFWVYQLYRFSGSEMVAANGDDPRFPKWVWYTFRENHKETTQLTAAQKKRILENRRCHATHR